MSELSSSSQVTKSKSIAQLKSHKAMTANHISKSTETYMKTQLARLEINFREYFHMYYLLEGVTYLHTINQQKQKSLQNSLSFLVWQRITKA